MLCLCGYYHHFISIHLAEAGMLHRGVCQSCCGTGGVRGAEGGMRGSPCLFLFWMSCMSNNGTLLFFLPLFYHIVTSVILDTVIGKYSQLPDSGTVYILVCSVQKTMLKSVLRRELRHCFSA